MQLSTSKMAVVLGSLLAIPAYAVVTNHPLPTKGSAPQVCYIKFMGPAQGSDMTRPASACTGTLIRANRVLTAGHCIPNIAKATSVEVVCNDGKNGYSVKGYEADPDYFESAEGEVVIQDRHDVALLDLDVNSKKKSPIAPIALVANDDEMNALLAKPDRCSLYGYGRTADGDNNTWGYLTISTIDYLTPADWKKVSGWSSDAQDIYIGPAVHAAPGDSGGPILCAKDDGSLVQIATTMEEGKLTDKSSAYFGFTYSHHETIPYNLDWITKAADLPALSHKL
jgi:V8-like Glu-specific endopeptidase